jgi:hypothetical protein
VDLGEGEHRVWRSGDAEPEGFPLRERPKSALDGLTRHLNDFFTNLLALARWRRSAL